MASSRAQLERSLMEGSYSRVWQLCRPSPTSTSTSSQLPRPEFAYFTSTLVQTVRNEIASCHERAYASLPLRDAVTLLFFEDEAGVRAFAAEVRRLPFPSPSRAALTHDERTQRNWSITSTTPATIHFPSSPLHPSKTGAPSALRTGAGVDERELNKEKVVSAALRYARELETIV